MPIDMKAAICRSASELLTKKRTKKLTVKDIVEECGITRQNILLSFSGYSRILSATLWSKVLRSFWKIVLLSQRLKIKFVTC